MLAGAGGALLGGPLGAAAGVGLWNGLYSCAEGKAPTAVAEDAVVNGVVQYAGGKALEAVGGAAVSYVGPRVAKLFGNEVEEAGAAAGRRGPKLWPFGRHNQTIARRIAEIKAEHPTWEHVGGGNLKEEWIPTPEGRLRWRRPDISFERPDRSVYREQVGKTLKSGMPHPREVDALDDIERVKGVRPVYTPYDR